MSNILGIWYTGNSAHPHILKASLESIHLAVSQSSTKVDVVVSSWRKTPNQWFVESCAPRVVTDFKVGNHFGIVCQLLKVLWEKLDSFTYLCFLEHDVLYPPTYFDQACRTLDENESKLGVFNTNYIGFRKEGWCLKSQSDLPTHQLTMKLKIAIEHLESLLRVYILNGFKCLEPDNKEDFLKVSFSGPPSVHINHTHHLTSHYNVFSKIPFAKVHDFWGDVVNYYP